MRNLGSVALIPEIRLIDTISTLPHVYGLEARFEQGELLTPRMSIVDSVAKRKRIP